MDPNMPTQKDSPALVLCWLAVGLPLAWGIWQTLQKSLALFH